MKSLPLPRLCLNVTQHPEKDCRGKVSLALEVPVPSIKRVRCSGVLSRILESEAGDFVKDAEAVIEEAS